MLYRILLFSVKHQQESAIALWKKSIKTIKDKLHRDEVLYLGFASKQLEKEWRVDIGQMKPAEDW